MSPSQPTAGTRPEELLRVAQEYADVFNAAASAEDVEGLIADACVDPLWDDRTNMLSFLADDPEDLGLVLSISPEEYVVVRHLGGGGEPEWVVDTSPVDWDGLEDEAFDEPTEG